MTVIPIILGSLGKGTKRCGKKRVIRDHSNNSFIKIGQNTKKSPEDLRLAVTQTLMENHWLVL